LNLEFYLMNKSVIVVAGIIVKKDLFLIGRRELDDLGAGYWEFPGGKLEKGETKEECLKRELNEELGITILNSSFFTSYDYSYPDITYEMNFFFVYDFTGGLLCHAHDMLKWIPYNDFNNYKLLPGDVPLIKFLENHDDFKS